MQVRGLCSSQVHALISHTCWLQGLPLIGQPSLQSPSLKPNQTSQKRTAIVRAQHRPGLKPQQKGTQGKTDQTKTTKAGCLLEIARNTRMAERQEAWATWQHAESDIHNSSLRRRNCRHVLPSKRHLLHPFNGVPPLVRQPHALAMRSEKHAVLSSECKCALAVLPLPHHHNPLQHT